MLLPMVARRGNRSWLGGISALTLLGLALAVSWAGQPVAPPPEKIEPVPDEDYPVYDQVVTQKFLTSRTRTVIIRRLTAIRLVPGGRPASLAFFHDQAFFEGRLDEELIRDFVLKATRLYRLEARFNFGVLYRLVSGDEPEGPEAFLAPIPAKLAQAPPSTIGVLEFSRVAFSAARDRALVYVGDNRPDGTGAGLLALLRRSGERWQVIDTDVVWVARPGSMPQE